MLPRLVGFIGEPCGSDVQRLMNRSRRVSCQENKILRDSSTDAEKATDYLEQHSRNQMRNADFEMRNGTASQERASVLCAFASPRFSRFRVCSVYEATDEHR